jgi:hypothetical protein
MSLPQGANFQSFLTVSGLLNAIHRGWSVSDTTGIELYWTAWCDPGVHTGFAIVLYANAVTIGADKVHVKFDETMQKMHICGWPGSGRPGAIGDPDMCNAALLSIHTELLTGDERQQVRTMVGRIRKMGNLFSGPGWDATSGDPHIGAAGIGAESFVNLRNERDADYLSPVRVRSMLAYAIEDEFGVDLLGQQPGDAKSAFSDIRMKGQDMYLPGPDHIRDALAHSLLAIRKHG